MVNRRTFLQQAGLFASAAVAFPAWQAPRRYKIGLQLFTLNAAMNRDPLGTLQRVAAMGYEEVETYGINPDALTYYGMPAADFARALRDHNLPTPTGHYDFQNLLNAGDDAMNRYVDRVTEGAKVLGQQYVVWPYLEPATRTLDTYKRVADRLNVIGARVVQGRPARGVSQRRRRVRGAERRVPVRHHSEGNRSGTGENADRSVLVLLRHRAAGA